MGLIDLHKFVALCKNSHVFLDNTPMLFTFYKDFKECMYVEADGDGGDGVLWFSAKLTEAS
jgi:hypothetical protein